jgi:hypothetical protein
MRYHELVENQDNDDDMFAPSDVTHANLRRVTFQQRIPDMIQDIIEGLGSNAGITIRAISSDLAAANRIFRGDQEVYELADHMITREAVQVLPGIMNTLAAEPEVIQDEDRLGDILMDFIPEVRAESELWAYVEEMLMEVYDEDDISKIEEIQYDCAQSMEYNLGSLLTKLIQQAYAETPAMRENIDDDDLFSNSAKIVRRGELTKQHINRKTVADKKGIAVGAKIKFLMPNGRYYTGRVVKLLPSGRIKIEYKINGIKYDRSLSPHNVRPEHVIGEDSDDNLFSTKKSRMPQGHNFVIYVNNHARGKAVSIEDAVDRATRYIAGVKDADPAARVHLQVIDDHDGEVMWSGGTGFEGKFYNAGKYVDPSTLEEAPLADYVPMGDFEKPGPFRGVDKRLVPHPTNQLKTARFFEQTPYDFRLFFSNIPGTGRYSEYGPMEPKVIQEIFKDQADQIIQGSENAITVVFVGNKGDSKVMLTPWMMAHRIGHAVQAGVRMSGGHSAWKEAESHFFRGINQLLKDFYGKGGNNRYDTEANWAMSREYAALFNAIGTQRSSRTGQIRRPYEFLYELFAQYLGTGKIELNPLPKKQEYGRKAWGRSTQSLNLRGDEEESKYTTEVLARDMEIMFNDVLGELVGKILVM